MHTKINDRLQYYSQRDHIPGGNETTLLLEYEVWFSEYSLSVILKRRTSNFEGD